MAEDTGGCVAKLRMVWIKQLATSNLILCRWPTGNSGTQPSKCWQGLLLRLAAERKSSGRYIEPHSGMYMWKMTLDVGVFISRATVCTGLQVHRKRGLCDLSHLITGMDTQSVSCVNKACSSVILDLEPIFCLNGETVLRCVVGIGVFEEWKEHS